MMTQTTNELPEIVRRAMVETIVDTGQLTATEIRTLNRYVKRGWLSKGKGGPYPILKTVYAIPTYNFAANRQAWIDYLTTLEAMDQSATRKMLRLREESLLTY